MRGKTVVIGLDGTSYSLIHKVIQQGVYPNISKLISAGSLREAKSTLHLFPRNTLISRLTALKDLNTNTHIIDKIHKREEFYEGRFFDRAPDLVIEPKHGDDLKGVLFKETLLGKGVFSGMHTYDDAFVYVNHKNIIEHPLEITDVAATILNSLDIPIAGGMDGKNFVIWN